MKKTNTAICLLAILACCLSLTSRAEAITRTTSESADHNTFQYTIDWSETIGGSDYNPWLPPYASDQNSLYRSIDIGTNSYYWRLFGHGYDSNGMTQAHLYWQDHSDQTVSYPTFIEVSTIAFDFSWDENRNFLGVDSIYLLSGNASIVQGESWVTITGHNPFCNVPDGGSSLLMLFSAVALLSGAKLKWAAV